MPPPLPDNPDSLHKALSKGLGRAVLALRQMDSAEFRETVLHACTYDLRYDRQCESERGQYLFDVIQATRESQYYRNHLLEFLKSTEEDADTWQAFEILRYFADCDSQVRNELYTYFDRDSAGNEIEGAELIALDGLEAFVYVSDRFIKSG